MQARKPKSPGAKKKAKPAGPGAIAADGEPASLDEPTESKEGDQPKEVESFAATGIDNALDLLEVVTAKMDKASIGAQASKIEQHPEVCFRIFYCDFSNLYFEI